MEESMLHIVAGYGPYAFGIVSLAAILGILSIIWIKVFRPEMRDRVKLAEAHVQVADSLKTVSSNVLKTGEIMTTSIERADRLADKLLNKLTED